MSNQSNSQSLISKGGINSMLNLDTAQKTHNVDFNFQILTIKKNDAREQGKEFFSSCLSDTINKYSGIIIIKEQKNETTMNLNDIIRVKKVSITKNKSGETLIFLISAFEIISQADRLFGNPLVYDRNRQYSHQNGHSNNSSNGNSVTKYMPLNSLTTFSKDFTILVKITRKHDMKKFNSKNGEGQLYSFSMLDSEGSEMECTVFNKTATRTHELIQEGGVYQIKGAYVKINDKKYSTIKSDYRLVLEDSVQITEKMDQCNTDFTYNYNFIKISDIANYPHGSSIDVIGKVIEVGERQDINTKNGSQELKKLKLADDTETQIEVSLWRSQAKNEFEKGEIVVFKNIKINDYNGKTLNTFDVSTIIHEPMIPEKTALDLFFNGKNIDAGFKKLSSSAASPESKLENLAYLKDVFESINQNITEDKLPIFKVKATLAYLPHSEKNIYLGCTECKKKMIEETYQIQCQSCNKVHEKANYIYAFSFRIKDATGEQYVDIFGNLAEKLLNIHGNEYRNIVVDKDDDKLRELSSEVEYQEYYFLIKPKVQMYNGQVRKRLSILKVDKVEINMEIKRLTNKIKNMMK